MSEPRLLSRVTSLIRRFRRDSRGNIAVIFGIAIIPIMSAIGCAVDYSLATRVKAKLQSAVDAAAVASISKNSPGYNAASQMAGNGEVSAAETDALNVFTGDVNVSGVGGKLSSNVVTKTGIQLTANLTFTAIIPTVFLQVIGYPALTVSGSSSASASLPPYLDFYLMLDVSGSMGLPSTTAEAQRMQWVSPDNYIQYPTGCTLACHFAPQNSACIDPGNSNATQGYPTNGYCLGYAISRVSQSGYQNLLQAQSPLGTYPYKNLNQNFPSTLGKSQQLSSTMVSGLPNSLYTKLPPVSSCPTDGTDACIQLRADAVGSALTQLFKTANQDELVSNQFRIGLYPFIQKLYTYFPLTSSINGSSGTPGTINNAAANLASLLDTNTNSSLGSGGTHLDTAFQTMNTTITSVGDGSSAVNTQPFVFLVTDGAQDNQIKGVPNGGWSGSNHATVMPVDGSKNPIDCKKLTDRGIIVSVLYIPYQQISPVNASFAGDEDDFANNNIPFIEPNLKACASPGFYFSAATPQGISDALQAMFQKSLQTAHITN
jgi:Flp pilus assembly protein TadG